MDKFHGWLWFCLMLINWADEKQHCVCVCVRISIMNCRELNRSCVKRQKPEVAFGSFPQTDTAGSVNI